MCQRNISGIIKFDSIYIKLNSNSNKTTYFLRKHISVVKLCILQKKRDKGMINTNFWSHWLVGREEEVYNEEIPS